MGAYSRLGANSKLGAYSNKYGTLLLFLSYFFQVMYLRQRLRWQNVFALFIRFSFTFPVFFVLSCYSVRPVCKYLFPYRQLADFPVGGSSWWGVRHPVLQILTPFSDQKSHFPHSFSDPPRKFHIRLPTRRTHNIHFLRTKLCHHNRSP